MHEGVWFRKNIFDIIGGVYCFHVVRVCVCVCVRASVRASIRNSPVENQNDLELDFKVFFFVDSCC